jgi:hypothetical protein
MGVPAGCSMLIPLPVVAVLKAIASRRIRADKRVVDELQRKDHDVTMSFQSCRSIRKIDRISQPRGHETGTEGGRIG